MEHNYEIFAADVEVITNALFDQSTNLKEDVAVDIDKGSFLQLDYLADDAVFVSDSSFNVSPDSNLAPAEEGE